MISPQFQSAAQLAIERMLNSLPEGVLIALFAWMILRILPKQNARSRFAVWFFALVAISGLPFFGGIAALNKFETPGFIPEGAAIALALPAHWAPIVFGSWILLACVPLARLGYGLFRLRQLKRSCIPVNSADFDLSTSGIIDELNSANSFWSRPVTLATSDQILVPAALGLWKPVIVLPSWALRELAPAELAIILRHEFAHIRRWDDWTNLIQKIVRAVFFFHPAVWWIENRLSVEREMACDDVVVAETGNPTGYASCLVSLLERSLAQRGWTMAQAIVHRAREASMRLAQILDRNRKVTTQLSKPALGLVGGFTLLCLIAVPNTPELVTFNRGSFDHGSFSATSPVAYANARDESPMIPSALVHRAVSHPGNDAAAPSVIPAAHKTDSLPSPKVVKDSVANLQTRSTERRAPELATNNLVADNFVGDNLDSMAASEVVIQMASMSSRNFLPVTRTLMFVETTQVGETEFIWGIQVWNESMPKVRVWRMTVIAPVWQQPQTVPVPNSI